MKKKEKRKELKERFKTQRENKRKMLAMGCTNETQEMYT
tara:strand:+ start:2857 stop:2973 length:117 start_codon:yes stop_codon:yes gene_type:complete